MGSCLPPLGTANKKATMQNIIHKPNKDVFKALFFMIVTYYVSYFRQHLNQPSQEYKGCSWLNKTRRVCKRIPE